jgi:hypothetical protein
MRMKKQSVGEWTKKDLRGPTKCSLSLMKSENFLRETNENNPVYLVYRVD